MLWWRKWSRSVWTDRNPLSNVFIRCFTSSFNSFWGNSFVRFYRPQTSLRRLCFYRCLSVHRGGVCGCWGGALFYLGGVHGFIRGGACAVLFGGACVVLFGGGHVRFYLGGHAWFYLGGSVRGFFSFFRYNEIPSMSGRYASYWNAFLFSLFFLDVDGINTQNTIHLTGINKTWPCDEALKSWTTSGHASSCWSTSWRRAIRKVVNIASYTHQVHDQHYQVRQKLRHC